MTKFKLANVEVVDGTVWALHREVSVKSVNITIDSGILNYMISPTSEHDFMMKSGFSKYPYKTWVKKVVVYNDNSVELFGYNLEKLQLKLKLTSEQIIYWKEYTESHIDWVIE